MWHTIKMVYNKHIINMDLLAQSLMQLIYLVENDTMKILILKLFVKFFCAIFIIYN